MATYTVIAGRSGGRFLDPAELRTLVAAATEVANHTMSHADLARLSGRQLAYQIDRSAERLAEITARWPTSLAYPGGATNSRVEAVVGACHQILEAFTTRPGAGETLATRLALPRIRVAPWTTPADLLRELTPDG